VLQAIKERCYDCSGFEWKMVRECDFSDCALHPYRLGKNPQRQGIGGNSDTKDVPAEEGAKNEP
jgi:hypothetical protein